MVAVKEKEITSHLERAKRRKRIADYVKGGKTIEQAARFFGVTLLTVRNCCATYGVKLAAQNIPHEKTYEIIHYLLFNRCTAQEAADRFNLSRARIQIIQANMRKAGIPLGIGPLINNRVPPSKLKKGTAA